MERLLDYIIDDFELYRNVFLYNSSYRYVIIHMPSYTEMQASATILNYTEIQEVMYEQSNSIT